MLIWTCRQVNKALERWAWVGAQTNLHLQHKTTEMECVVTMGKLRVS